MKYLATILISMGLLITAGCSGLSNEIIEKPALELVQEGMESYEDGSYTDAIKNFEQLRDWYPFSKYAILAELKIADSHYHLEEYEEAIAAYEEFEQLHPRNEAIPYIIHQIGQCYYQQIESVDRDQRAAQKALKVFRRLTQQFPDTLYANIAKVPINKCLKNLAAHDFYVGRFYFKDKRYKAALQRFLFVIKNYPDMGIHHKALYYISTCESLINQTRESDT